MPVTERGALGRATRWAAAGIALGLVGCAGTSGVDRVATGSAGSSRTLPWEWWRDPAIVASVPDGDRTVMRSSHCPSGCELDRHSPDEPRFVEVRRGEGVIFEAEGAGAVTRIWMVMGDGVSDPLDPTIRLRVRVDGDRRPVVDLPLPDLFSGTTAPFLPPLVVGRSLSGGGSVSYVPIPFRDGCTVSLVGAGDATIWFQVTARLVADPTGVRSFTGHERFDDLRTMLDRAGSDPWPTAAPPAAAGTVVLPPGGAEVLATLDGPDMVNGIILRVKRSHWPRLGLRLTFDDRPPRLIPLMDLFGIPNTAGPTTRSLMVGADDAGDLYCYFPMPFFDRAVVELLRRPVEGPARVRVDYALRTAGRSPRPDAGTFEVHVRRHDGRPGRGEIEVLDLEGAGAWVGLAAELAPGDRRGWAFLEGDERIFIDGEPTPSWHGTGVEDLFNGGFYFRISGVGWSPFASALAGAPHIHRARPRVDMYRLLLGDAVVFSDALRAVIEAGPTGNLGLEGTTIAYTYRRLAVGPERPSAEGQ